MILSHREIDWAQDLAAAGRRQQRVVVGTNYLEHVALRREHERGLVARLMTISATAARFAPNHDRPSPTGRSHRTRRMDDRKWYKW